MPGVLAVGVWEDLGGCVGVEGCRREEGVLRGVAGTIQLGCAHVQIRQSCISV